MKRTILASLCVLMILGLGLLALGACDRGQKDYAIKVGLSSTASLCMAPFFIANEKGFYAEEGLEFEEIKIDVNQAHQLLTTGQIDVTNFLLSGMIQPLSNGLDVKIPLGLHTGCIKVLADPASDIRTAADLRGTRIGISGFGAPSTLITQRCLARLGINVGPDGGEVEWLVFPPGELPLALERGQVDAIAMNDPAAWIVEQAGKGRVIINTTTDDYLKDEICCVVEASGRVYKDHPEELAKFVRALQKASRFVDQNPEETAQILADKQYVPGDPAVNAQVLKTYNYNASVSGAREAILRNARELQQIGIVDVSVDVDALADDIFVALPGVPDSL
jgi:NitT/TauT family transport system substrate-binding protein